MNLPAPIRRITGDRPFTVDKTGMSKARILCFDDMVLKIQPQDASAQKECRMMQWLSGKLPVPRVIACHEEQGTQYLLMSRIPGEMACAPAFLQAPEALVDRSAFPMAFAIWTTPNRGPTVNTVFARRSICSSGFRTTGLPKIRSFPMGITACPICSFPAAASVDGLIWGAADRQTAIRISPFAAGVWSIIYPASTPANSTQASPLPFYLNGCI